MMSKKLLYTSCHPWLERSDVHIFSSLGFDVFSTGYFQDPKSPTSPYVKPLSIDVNSAMLKEFKQDNPKYQYGYKIPLRLGKEFISKFDVIVVSWRYDYLMKILPHVNSSQLVVFQTVGQSDGPREKKIAQVRNSSGVQVIRISDTERNFPAYGGEDAIIDLSVDVSQFKTWTGEDPYILSINKMMWRTRECNVNYYLKATEGFDRRLYGTDNEKFQHDFSLGPISPDDLIDSYSKARLSFSLGTKPAPVTLTFKEAMAAGCPVVTWGPLLGNGRSKTYCAYRYIENGVNGFFSDNIEELRKHIKALLDSKEYAALISHEARETAIKKFSWEAITPKWREFFKGKGVL